MNPDEKRRNGLTVGAVQIGNIAVKDSDGDSVYRLTVDIKKQ